MTRKDYINIAAAISTAQVWIKGEFDRTLCDNSLEPAQRADFERNRELQLRGVRRAAAHLADFLADDNPRFDQARFLSACGYGATKPRSVDEVATHLRAAERRPVGDCEGMDA